MYLQQSKLIKRHYYYTTFDEAVSSSISIVVILKFRNLTLASNKMMISIKKHYDIYLLFPSLNVYDISLGGGWFLERVQIQD